MENATAEANNALQAVCCIRILSIRIKISPVLNAYVVMTSSLLHKDTENSEKNKRFPSTEPFPGDPYRAYCGILIFVNRNSLIFIPILPKKTGK